MTETEKNRVRKALGLSYVADPPAASLKSDITRLEQVIASNNGDLG